MSPAGINHTYHTNQGKFYKDQRVKDWEEECLWILKKAIKPLHITKVSIYFIFNNLRKNDIDGRIKSVLDLLQKAGFYNDDSLVDELRVYKRYDSKKASIVIEL